MSPDQSIRITQGKVMFDPPLKVAKQFQLRVLGNLKVGSTVREAITSAASDRINIDLISSPIDLEIRPDETLSEMLMKAHDNDQVTSMAFGAESASVDWELLETEGSIAFGCSNQLMSAAPRAKRRELKKRRKTYDGTLRAAQTARTKNPEANEEQLMGSILAILLPFVPAFLRMFLLSGLQKLILDWIMDKLNITTQSEVYGGDTTVPAE